jgi:hypothetical protein
MQKGRAEIQTSHDAIPSYIGLCDKHPRLIGAIELVASRIFFSRTNVLLLTF